MPKNQGTSRKGKPKAEARAAGMGKALLNAHTKVFKPKDNGSSRGAGMEASGAGNLNETIDDNTKKSILEMDSLEDFIASATMADKQFESEREHFVVIDTKGQEFQRQRLEQFGADGLQGSDRNHNVDRFDFEGLKVPRRPQWDATTTKEELDKMERSSFLDWRRTIAVLEEGRKGSVTPFEKNIEVWRQLWRVLERSACVVQIVDGRNPLFYLSADLRKYATEELGKPMIVIVNKSDYLSETQRRVWSEHLTELKIEHVFFSAFDEQKKIDDAYRLEVMEEKDEDAAEEEEEEEEEEDSSDEDSSNDEGEGEQVQPAPQEEQAAGPEEIAPTAEVRQPDDYCGIKKIFERDELVEFLRAFAVKNGCETDPRYLNRIQFGMVGFPNVGKSSCINVLVGAAKFQHGVTRVGVASTPGKTKHFQTLIMPEEDDMMLCDCPGLVFPSFVSSTADMICAGVFPISQMRNIWPVVSLVVSRIPREIFNGFYGIKIPVVIPDGWADANVPPPPTAEEVLTAYCVARSLLTAGTSNPDHGAAARVIVRDYVEGKLLFNHPPPCVEPNSAEEVDFARETVLNNMQTNKKLQAKLAELREIDAENDRKAALLERNEKAASSHGADVGDDFDDEDIDLDILDFVNGGVEQNEKAAGGNRGKAHKSKQGWGKKGRKLKDKDPYGCHKEGGESILLESSGGANSGLHVAAGGKKGRKEAAEGKNGYTRPAYNAKNAGAVQRVA
jgi:large subunit GTPase 1